MLYATAVNNTINKNEDYHNGKIVMKNIKHKTFKGKLSNFQIITLILLSDPPKTTLGKKFLARRKIGGNKIWWMANTFLFLIWWELNLVDSKYL